MKKIGTLALLLVATTSPAWAIAAKKKVAPKAKSAAPSPETKKAPLIDQIEGGSYGTAGCGLGSVVFGAKPGMIQIAAAFLNESVSANQTFGISSGTLNCATAATTASASQYIDVNRIVFSREVSRGEGETVAALAEIFGCQDKAHFGVILQQNYQEIFPSSDIDASSVSRSLLKAVESDSVLSAQCKNLG